MIDSQSLVLYQRLNVEVFALHPHLKHATEIDAFDECWTVPCKRNALSKTRTRDAFVSRKALEAGRIFAADPPRLALLVDC